MADIGKTYGSLLVGGLSAFFLSGIVAVQAIIFFKTYPDECTFKKGLVSAVWILDIIHSAFIGSALIHFFITNYGHASGIGRIHWSIALSVVVTALQTLITHCFLTQKIHKSARDRYNRYRWLITGPILFLAFCRLVSACASAYEMMHLGRFRAFLPYTHFPGWLFTLGLVLSVSVDLLITGWLFYFLREFRNKMGATLMVHVVDSLTLYTLENGLLPCIATLVALICWLSMRNLVFLGLHFVIAKLYANSLLASLNTRKELREMRSHMQPWVRDPAFPILSGDDFTPPTPPETLARMHALDPALYRPPSKNQSRKLEVNVQQVIERSSDDAESIQRAYMQGYDLRRAQTVLQWRSGRLP